MYHERKNIQNEEIYVQLNFIREVTLEECWKLSERKRIKKKKKK